LKILTVLSLLLAALKVSEAKTCSFDLASRYYQAFLEQTQQIPSHDHSHSRRDVYSLESNNSCISHFAHAMQEYVSFLDQKNQELNEFKTTMLHGLDDQPEQWKKRSRVYRDQKLVLLLELADYFHTLSQRLNPLVFECLGSSLHRENEEEILKEAGEAGCSLVLNQFEEERVGEFFQSLLAWDQHFMNSVNEELFELDWDRISRKINNKQLYQILSLLLARYQDLPRSYLIPGSIKLGRVDKESFSNKMLTLRHNSPVEEVGRCAQVHYQALVVLHPKMRSFSFKSGKFRSRNSLPEIESDIVDDRLSALQNKKLNREREELLHLLLKMKDQHSSASGKKEESLRQIEKEIEEALLALTRKHSLDVLIRENSLLKTNPMSGYFKNLLMGDCLERTLEALEFIKTSTGSSPFVEIHRLREIWIGPGLFNDQPLQSTQSKN